MMPNQFTPVNSSGSQQSLVNAINTNFRKLDAESVTKSFGGQNSEDKLFIGKTGQDTLGLAYKKNEKDKVIVGKLPDGTYGIIFYDDNDIPIIYMSVDADGKPTMKVAKSGKNAQTGTDNDLIFNSNQDVLKVVKTMDFQFTYNYPEIFLSNDTDNGGSNAAQLTVNHGLNFVPLVIWTVIVPGTTGNSATLSAGSIYSTDFGASYTQQYYWTLNANSTNLVIGLYRRYGGKAGSTLGSIYGTLNIRAYLLQENATT